MSKRGPFFIRYKKGSFYFIKQIKASVSLEVSKGGNGLITCIANLVAPCGTGAWTGSTASRRAPCCTSSLREQQQWVLLIEKKKPKTWDAGGLCRLPAPAAMELPVRSFVSRILSSSPLFTAHRGPRRRRLLSRSGSPHNNSVKLPHPHLYYLNQLLFSSGDTVSCSSVR
jgi:hypothetical protein